MHPITIQLNDIASSRDQEFEVYQTCSNEDTEGEADWRAKIPEKPSFVLECDGVYVLSISIEESMRNNTHTVMVEDGANCTLRVRNTTSLVLPGSETEGVFERYLICDPPIWFIDYTIFHGGNIATGVEQVEILTQHSSENEFAYFDRVPECYFTSLIEQVDTASFYTASSPLNEAFHWLVRDGSGYSECGREFFFERFALSVMNFAMNRNAAFINEQLHCYWPGITCNALRKVTQINLPKKDLKGAIPSELKLLTTLDNLFLCKYIVCIETERNGCICSEYFVAMD